MKEVEKKGGEMCLVNRHFLCNRVLKGEEKQKNRELAQDSMHH